MPPDPTYTDPTWLGFALESVLTTAASKLTTSVDRQFVSHGLPPFDCPNQLTVHISALRATNPLTRSDIGPQCKAVIPAMDLAVTIVRCVPTLLDNGKLPSATDITTANQQLLQDLWELWRGLVDETIDGTLIPGLGCSAFTWRQAVPIGPSGGFAAWQLNLEVALT